MARVLEGSMNVLGDSIEILWGTNATPAQFARLQELLRNAQETKQPPEEVAAAVKRELPNFTVLANQLLVPKTAGEFYALIAVIVGLIALGRERPTTVYEDRRVIVNQTVEQIYNTPPPASPQPAPARSTKHGRNEPCPCGSRKKYKHCCGRLK